MAVQEDEIQLVNRTEMEDFPELESDGPLTGGEDGPSMKIDYSDTEDSEPQIADERHIKHPGKFRMKLRVRDYLDLLSFPPSY